MATNELQTQAVLLPEGTRRNFRPVKQQSADSYLILFIAAFGITVLLVRVFLQASGYPQIGDSTFHIAHLLWGGVLLFLSLIVLLVWSNNWVYWASALMGGIGVGLFIDEVGKFITQSNDYFFPLAFPIIYAFLLVCVWLYLRVRRSVPRDTRTLLYHALGDLKQVIDNDLDPFEYTLLVGELNQVLQGNPAPNERILANALLSFVRAADLELARSPNTIERAWVWTKFVASQWPARRVFKWLLVLGFGLAGVSALLKIGTLLVLRFDASSALEFTISHYVIVSGKSEYVVDNPLMLIAQTLGILATGILSAAAVVLLLFGRERRALRVGTLGLAISLTIVNLLTFYFSQLYAVTDALAQLLLLMGATIYRWRFFINK